MEQLLGGMLVGCILFFAIVYVLRAILGPKGKGDKFFDKFKKKWAWNIFQPHAVDYAVCKKAKVFTEANCEEAGAVTDATCVNKGFAKVGNVTNFTTPTADQKDEYEFMDLYNTNRASVITTTLSDQDASNVYFAGYLAAVQSKDIGADEDLTTCAGQKAALSNLMDISTISNAQAANLLSSCSLYTGGDSSGTGHLVKNASATKSQALVASDYTVTSSATKGVGLLPLAQLSGQGKPIPNLPFSYS